MLIAKKANEEKSKKAYTLFVIWENSVGMCVFFFHFDKETVWRTYLLCATWSMGPCISVVPQYILTQTV